MARYEYAHYDLEGNLDYYRESGEEHDMHDEEDGELYVAFSGNGFLRFWAECKKATLGMAGTYRYLDTYTGETTGTRRENGND